MLPGLFFLFLLFPSPVSLFAFSRAFHVTFEACEHRDWSKRIKGFLESLAGRPSKEDKTQPQSLRDLTYKDQQSEDLLKL